MSLRSEPERQYPAAGAVGGLSLDYSSWVWDSGTIHKGPDVRTLRERYPRLDVERSPATRRSFVAAADLPAFVPGVLHVPKALERPGAGVTYSN